MKKLEELIRQRGRESAQAQLKYCESAAGKIDYAALSLARILNAGGKILMAGNGGSAADAQHFSAELVGRFLMERRPLACLALTTNSSVLTSIANDYSFEQVFSKQVAALGGENDALIAISTSGSSPNILRALETANTRSMLTVGLTGSDCDRMAPLCDICLDVNNTSTPRVQEVHHLILHIIAELIEIRLFAGQEA
ncbi:MAG TPA: SIS domain-containing protein [Proteobacteria bacterium]|nr:phosphoheptose isomerase 1 [bacterium BMS3Abin14]HDL53557.1 SIS domain-containing protein [Pseudomonadota bacterium]